MKAIDEMNDALQSHSNIYPFFNELMVSSIQVSVSGHLSMALWYVVHMIETTKLMS